MWRLYPTNMWRQYPTSMWQLYRTEQKPQIYNQFGFKIAVTETNVHSLLFLKKTLCNQSIGLWTFVNGINKTFFFNQVTKIAISAVTFETIMQFECPSRLRIRKKKHLQNLFYQKD